MVLEERRHLQARRLQFMAIVEAEDEDSEEEHRSYLLSGKPEDLFTRPVATRKHSRSELSTSSALAVPPVAEVTPLFHPRQLLLPPPSGPSAESSQSSSSKPRPKPTPAPIVKPAEASTSSSSIVRVASGSRGNSSREPSASGKRLKTSGSSKK